MHHEIFANDVVLPDGKGGLHVTAATLRIVGHTIEAVIEGRTPNAIFVDGLLAPALVNPHTHLSMSAFRGIGGHAIMRGNVVEDLYFKLENDLQPEDVACFTRMGIAESLLAGVGTVWDHYYFGSTLAEACVETGITAVIAPTLQDLEGPGVGQLEEQLAATLAIADDPRLQEAGVVAALGPHATDTVSAALFSRIASLAERHQLPLHLHAAQSVEEYRRAIERHNTTPIRWLRREGWLDAAPSALLVHVLYANRADLEGLDPERIALGYCPASQIQYCFPAHTTGWRELGMRIAIGTDSGACNDTMNLQQELRLAASGPLFGVVSDPAFRSFWEGDLHAAEEVASRRNHLQAGSEIPPTALLQTVLEHPGTLHPNLRVGAIRPGYRANLVLYNQAHPSFWPGTGPLRALALQDVAPAIQRMMLNGSWLSAAGEHQRSLLEAPWLKEAQAQAEERLPRFLRVGRIPQRP